MYHREEPVWDAKTMNMKKGDTTFKQCGWCKHRGCGSYRYDCMLEGYCNLQRDYKDDLKWDTPCNIMNMGKKDIQELIGYKNYHIKECNEDISRSERDKKFLQELLAKAEDSPPDPHARGSNHFPLRSRVAVIDHRTHQWRFGTVVYGYRSGDGCVSFMMDGEPEPSYTKLPNEHPKDDKKGFDEHQKLIDSIGALANASGCGMCVPSVMLLSEFEYFAEHPDTYRRWIATACDGDYNGETLSPKDFPFPKREMLPKVEVMKKSKKAKGGA